MRETLELCPFCKRMVITRLDVYETFIRKYCPNCFKDIEIVTRKSDEDD